MAKETGTVQKYFAHKNFGFIESDLGGKNIFFHAAVVQDGVELAPGDRVEFEPKSSAKGPAAQSVRLLDDQPETVGGGNGMSFVQEA
jgi:cold shock CspA family protein